MTSHGYVSIYPACHSRNREERKAGDEPHHHRTSAAGDLGRCSRSEPARAEVTAAAKAPNFAAVVGVFRADHDSEVEAAAALQIGVSTLSDYCDGKSLPTTNGIKRLAPALDIPADELAALFDAQRAAQARGEQITIVPPVRTRVRRQPIISGQGA